MKTTLYPINLIGIFMTALLLVACNNHDNHKHDAEGNHMESKVVSSEKITSETTEHNEEIKLNSKQIELLNITIDSLTKRQMSGVVLASGQLAVPPQNEANVTTILGANINSIKVMEGDKVKKGTVLAYISHPDIIRLQTDYLQTYNKLQFLEQEYARQKTLFDANVGSGRDYQKRNRSYQVQKGSLKDTKRS